MVVVAFIDCSQFMSMIFFFFFGGVGIFILAMFVKLKNQDQGERNEIRKDSVAIIVAHLMLQQIQRTLS